MTKISIITNKKVDKTFESEDCLLQRTILNTYKDVEKRQKRYVILTERCNYVDQQIPIVDEEGNPVLDEDGNPTYTTNTVLKVLSKKDSETVRTFSFDEINGLYDAIKDQIPSGLSKIDEENLEEQIALLVLTQQDKPYGTAPEDWEVL